MKRILIAIMAALLIASTAACSESKSPEITGGGAQIQGEETEDENENDDYYDDEDGEFIGGGLRTAPIIFDFSCGSPEENLMVETHYAYEDITDEELIEMLTDMSGLDFFVTISEDDDRTVIDWAANSTLVAGLDDREQKEDFVFYDSVSLNWFMMDSLWRTLDEREIYYTMDGGKELQFDEFYPITVIPSDQPYMGSAFYYNHADNVGDETDLDKEDADDVNVADDENVPDDENNTDDENLKDVTDGVNVADDENVKDDKKDTDDVNVTDNVFNTFENYEHEIYEDENISDFSVSENEIYQK